ncbi:uncharacterized protein BT62DRAFT_923699 [Guyanagaster necrorhizus]|uniref:Uncharacterized protein n=1 Tax=Guyanagaster necrorhizus TaxID=856835 RepID=A0A9P7VHQ8_9AGAR|nr:uncharacterized protein BT62DRAFT_923699 [Guyanagaster necrorhizus MCA 3950]KAG7440822.1 hypothetical protein BT62DRAFT_923699 [Guyanagaster necrorhizus MCA 3950]
MTLGNVFIRESVRYRNTSGGMRTSTGRHMAFFGWNGCGGGLIRGSPTRPQRIFPGVQELCHYENGKWNIFSSAPLPSRVNAAGIGGHGQLDPSKMAIRSFLVTAQRIGVQAGRSFGEDKVENWHENVVHLKWLRFLRGIAGSAKDYFMFIGRLEDRLDDKGSEAFLTPLLIMSGQIVRP